MAAYIAAMPGWKRAVGARIDGLVTATLPGVARAVRWNTPFWGIPGRGWFLGFNCLDRYVKVAFLNGARLVPPPPVASRRPEVRYLHIHEGEEVDAAGLADWLRQAAAIDGAPLF